MAKSMRRTQLVAVVGPPLQGKTTISERIAEATGYFWKDTDALRVGIFGFRNQPMATPEMIDLTPLAEINRTEREVTSEMLLIMTEGLLARKESVIITARSIGRPENISHLQAIAKRTSAELKVIRCMAIGADREEIERRMAATGAPGIGSNVRPFVTYEQYLWILEQRREEEQGEQPYPHVLINMMESLDECVAKALAYIRSE
jgi:predicted kinase